MDESSIVILKSVQGIEYVRPPTLDFLKVKDNNDYTEFKIVTKKNSKKKSKNKRPNFKPNTTSLLYLLPGK